MRNKKSNEIKKLLFQNNSFLDVHVALYPEDIEAQHWLADLKKINHDFLETKEINKEQLNKLLEINNKARLFYNNNDPEIKFYKSGYTKQKPKKFDQKFHPLMGWKEYYKHH